MAAYTTSTAVATLLGTSFSTSTDPTTAEVNDIIARVEDFVEQVTGRIWTTATTTELFDTVDETRRGYGEPLYSTQDVQKVFFLRNRPAISIESIQVNSGGLSSENWITRATGYAGDALFYGAEGYVWFHNQAPDPGRRNVRIRYTYGVSATPNDIKYATELLVAEEVLNIQEGGQQLTSVSIGDAAYQWGSIAEQQEAYHGKAMKILQARGFSLKAEML